MGEFAHDPVASDVPEALLCTVPFFCDLDRVDIARLAGALDALQLAAGTLVFEEGAEADALYLLERGRVAAGVRTAEGERSVAEIDAPAYFGELGLLLSRRTASARAQTDIRLWRLPRERFERLTRERPAIGLAVAQSLAGLVDQRSRERVGASPLRPPQRPTVPLVPRPARPPVWRLVGAALALGVPAALWLVEPPSGLSAEAWRITLILLGAALAWLFESIPDFLVALLMAAAWGLAGLVPLPAAFAGFASSSWVAAVGALALAAAMAHSGLLYRLALTSLRTFPSTHFGQVLALLVGGLVITPLVPLRVARVAAVSPLAQELVQALGYPVRSRASAGLAFAAVLGYGSFSGVFLTGLAMNFFVLELLPLPDRARFGWLGWLLGAAPAGLVLLAGLGLALLVLFRPESPPRATPEKLLRQERVLGPLSPRERATILGLAMLLVGLLLQPVLSVDVGWLALGALAVVVAGNVVDRERFRGSIDWGFLVLFGVLLGTGGVLRGAGVDRWLVALLLPVGRAVDDPGMLVMLLALFVVVCRLVVPWIPATLLLSLALVPAAPELGLSPWVAGFVVLTAGTTWLFPGQSLVYELMRDASGGELCTDRQWFAVGVALTLVTLLAIAASLPYWRALGLLA